MRTPCEYITRYVLPRLRAKIAEILMENYGWKQVEVAKKLKISQSAVSKYRGVLKASLPISPDSIDQLAYKLAERIAKDEISVKEFIYLVCRLCCKLRMGGPICYLHMRTIPELSKEECKVCFELIREEEVGVTEREKVLENMKIALREIISDEKFARLIPEVRMNLVMAISNAKDLEDIAGIPGRITIVKGKPFTASEPEFGASKHLASVLLIIMKRFSNIRAAICVKYDEEIRRAISICEMKYVEIKRENGFLETLRDKIELLKKEPDAIVDLGGWGIEPITYVFGRNAVEVIEKCRRILEALEV